MPPVQLGWPSQQRVWNRRISSKECRMLKGILGCCHKKARKDTKASGNPNTLFLVVNWRPILTDIAARFLQYSKFLARYSSVPAAGKYRNSRTHWTCVVQGGPRRAILPVGICAGSGDPRTATGDPRTAGRDLCGVGDPRTATGDPRTAGSTAPTNCLGQVGSRWRWNRVGRGRSCRWSGVR